MFALPKGVAQISYRGGSICLPARSLYDRQILAEEVRRQCRRHGSVQVLLDDERWLICVPEVPLQRLCIDCGRSMHCACRSDCRGEAQFCIACAVGEVSDHSPVQHPAVA